MDAFNNYTSDLAIHPGETLKELLSSYEMTQEDLANRTGMAVKTINEIIKGKNSVTPETAIKLSSVFGMSESFWNNLEKNYQADIARLKRKNIIRKNIEYLKKFTCYNELAKYNYVPKTFKHEEKVVNLQRFFGVSDLSYVDTVLPIAFKKVKGGKVNYGSIAAWLRCGEIEAHNIETKKFDRKKMVQKIPELRKLTRERPEEYSRKIKEICSEFGVAVVYTPYFKNTYVNGATKWLSKEKAIIQLNLRGVYSDIFWFSFFHELAHLLKHGKKDQFIEFKNEKFRIDLQKEKEADDYAKKILIPQAEYEKFRKNEDFSNASIQRFAKKMGICTGIVAGRIARDYNKWSSLEHLREKLKLNNNS
jgi:HTH-type transcriptional regulator/antitoxin HigA